MIKVRQPQGIKPALPALSTGQAVGRFFSNGAKLVRNCGQNMLQDPRTLQRNSLIISTLVLVLSRIGTANASAIRAKNTPEESHREKEAIKTTIRELGGWTLGYIVFRAIEHTAKTYLQNTLNYRTNRKSSFINLCQGLRREWGKMTAKTAGQLEKLDVKLTDEFKLLEPVTAKALHGEAKELSEAAAGKALENWRLPGFLKKFTDWAFLRGAPTALDKIKRLHTWIPLMVGGIPAVLLSGYALEWFTQNHSQKVIDAVTQAKNGGLPPPPANPKAPAAPDSDQAFSAYLQQIQLKRSERGIG